MRKIAALRAEADSARVRTDATHVRTPNDRPKAARAVFVIFCAWLAGCSTEMAPAGSSFIVSADRAQFYKYGPAQSFGADFVLPKGQRVIMLQRSFGFSKVMTEDGTSGWIASEEIGPAPPLPRKKTALASARRGGSDRMYAGPRKSSKVDAIPGDPLFDMSDLPPPMKDEPPLPKPDFRVNPKPK